MTKEKIEELVRPIISSLDYNRTTEDVIEIVECCIARATHKNVHFMPQNVDIVGDVDLVYGIIVLAFGEYGTSPRYGWFKNECLVLLEPILETILIELQTEHLLQQEY